ncbi:Glu/Leu/Phe/Val dehydrogenase dimerization domain-containing protein [Kiloniella laminariae]|uniref:Glu/Leu/Phe/Val dehydrogenase dimerization domain-containing protein n=1 Tax=Kiloniella laminariae TaxID=454162 RepID=UPI000373C649|nr:Glu/Leu/Phe/Val dehydrogenase dimerization domain-containing protein [Kiloniella laminariae]
MSVFNHEAFAGHEQVVFCHDAISGLKAIIAVHSTALGPAAGGCRMWSYASDEEALRDALRLSRGMSYKNAMAGLELGGGKAVIIGDAGKDKSEALFRSFGRFVEGLSGKYITAEDVGISVSDMEIVAQETDHVGGLNSGQAASGDPSPFTARGTFNGIRAAVRHRLGKQDVRGLVVAVQGLGHVGWHLCEELHRAGAKLIVADINDDITRKAVSAFGATAVSCDEILFCDADVVAPCALGAIMNEQSIPRIKARIVAGAANNQLSSASDGDLLRLQKILYAPDYVINAGGIINVAGEIIGRYDRTLVDSKVASIHDVLLDIFIRADREGRATSDVADSMAQEKILQARQRQMKGTGAGRTVKHVA